MYDRRAAGKRIIAKYMKINDPKLAATKFDFAAALMPDYIAPTLDGIEIILENFGKEYPNAARRANSLSRDGTSLHVCIDLKN